MDEAVATTLEGAREGRVAEFESEVARLRLKGANAEPERRLVLLGALLMVVGLVLAIAGWISSNGTNNSLNQNTDLTMSVAGLAVTVVGAIIWLRHSLSRYGRYWLARAIYEQRQQTDRIVEAVAGGAGRGGAGPTQLPAAPDIVAPPATPTVESH